MAKILDKGNLVKGRSEKYLMVSESFNDLSRRSRAAKESISTGYDGMEVASLTTGISRLTIEKEIKEIVEKDYLRDSTGRNEVKENEPG